MRHAALAPMAIGMAISTALGCDGANRSTPLGPSLRADLARHLPTEKRLSLDLCALDPGEFTLVSTNLYFPIAVGSEWFLSGDDEGVATELRIVVLDATEVVRGVATRVIEEREWQNGDLHEVSRNYFAATDDGTVCYFGESVDFYENGQIVSHDGSWRADAPGSAPGIIMPADPQPGVKFRMEHAPGIAADAGEIIGIGPVRVPAGSFRETIRVRETNLIDGDVGYKIFAKGIGLVRDGALSLVSIDAGDASETARSRAARGTSVAAPRPSTTLSVSGG